MGKHKTYALETKIENCTFDSLAFFLIQNWIESYSARLTKVHSDAFLKQKELYMLFQSQNLKSASSLFSHY